MNNMIAWALAYASRGLPVFPLVEGEKRPATRNGFLDATTDEERIRNWWEGGNPHFNIGAPTGVLYDIIDVDTDEGARAVAAWQARGSFPACHGIINTPKHRPGTGVGQHYMVSPTGLGRAPGFLPGVDGLGTDGYSVLPPSVVDGKPYVYLMMIDWEALSGAAANRMA